MGFANDPNFEDPQDADADHVYQITVIATDSTTSVRSELEVTVTVTNVDEPGRISAITGAIQVGRELTAGTITDPDSPHPDSPVTPTGWQWQDAADDSNIAAASSAPTYTLTADEVGKTLQVIVTYTDGHGPDKTVTSAATDAVLAATETLSSDADLTGLTLSAGAALSPAFAADIVDYTAEVGNAVTRIRVTPEYGTATVTVNMNPNRVASGRASAPIDLNVGENAIPIVVTAQDATTTKTYTVTVTRAASTDANLASLTLMVGGNPIMLNEAVAPDLLEYTARVPAGTTAVVITATSANPNAGLDLDGAELGTGSVSERFGINTGTTRFVIDITAEDGTTTKKYAVTITVPVTANTAPPVIATDNQVVEFPENSEDRVATFTATDAEGDAITWSLAGDDQGLFAIISTTGQMDITNPLDFENPIDANADGVYEITVIATDDGVPPLNNELAVTIRITDADDPGSIGIIDGDVRVGQTLTAPTVTDQDDVVAVTAHQWQADSTDIDGDAAEAETYLLTAAEEGKKIRVMVTYTDSGDYADDDDGSGKEVTSRETRAVVSAAAPARPTLELTLDTGLLPDDGITNDGRVNVTALAAGATWKYSTNSGTDFTAGTDIDSDTSVAFFTLPRSSSYALGQVQAVQTLGGIDSAAAYLPPVTVDTTAPVINVGGRPHPDGRRSLCG